MAIDQDYLTLDEKAEYAALRSVADAGRAVAEAAVGRGGKEIRALADALDAHDALDEQGEHWVGLVLADGAGKLRRHAKGVTFDDLFGDVPDDGEAAQ